MYKCTMYSTVQNIQFGMCMNIRQNCKSRILEIVTAHALLEKPHFWDCYSTYTVGKPHSWDCHSTCTVGKPRSKDCSAHARLEKPHSWDCFSMCSAGKAALLRLLQHVRGWKATLLRLLKHVPTQLESHTLEIITASAWLEKPHSWDCYSTCSVECSCTCTVGKATLLRLLQPVRGWKSRTLEIVTARAGLSAFALAQLEKPHSWDYYRKCAVGKAALLRLYSMCIFERSCTCTVGKATLLRLLQHVHVWALLHMHSWKSHTLEIVTARARKSYRNYTVQ